MQGRNGPRRGERRRRNGSAPFFRALVIACRRKRSWKSRRVSGGGRTISKIIARSYGLLIGSRNVSKRAVGVSLMIRMCTVTLKIGGKGFIHHSNFGEYANSLRERLPPALTKLLIKAEILDWAHHRNPSMSADLFRALCAQHGLHCLSQELVNWRGRRLIDCFSLFVRSDSTQQKSTKIIRNPNFMREAALICAKSQISKGIT